LAAISGEIARPAGGGDGDEAGRAAPAETASLDGVRGVKIGGSDSTGGSVFGLGFGCAATNDTPHEAK
jgi:hypothetical protein